MTKQYRIRGGSAQEIADSVEAAIEAGELRPGQPFPSVRKLAAELKVSPGTVASALTALRQRGVLVTHARSRSHVSWRPPLAASVGVAVDIPGARDLATGNPDPALLPDLAPFLGQLDATTQLYGGQQAHRPLLELAAAEFESAGIPGEHLAVVGGALDGIERALAARLRPGDLVGVEDPGYAGLFHLLRALGLALRPIEIDERGVIPGALEQAVDDGIQAVIFTPRGQNPTGATLYPERADALAAILGRAPELMVIEDDHLGPIAGAPRATAIRERPRWAAARSVSKSLGPDLRVAVLAGDSHTISQVRGRQLVGPQWVSHLLQRLVAALWSDAATVASLQRASEIYAERRERFIQALAQHRIDITAPAGLNVWIPVADETTTAQALLARGWAIAPGAPYRLQSSPAIRVTVSTLQATEADELADAIASAQRPQPRTQAA